MKTAKRNLKVHTACVGGKMRKDFYIEKVREDELHYVSEETHRVAMNKRRAYQGFNRLPDL